MIILCYRNIDFVHSSYSSYRASCGCTVSFKKGPYKLKSQILIGFDRLSESEVSKLKQEVVEELLAFGL